MLNRTTIIGRLTRDPELRHTQSGVTVCNITVAVDRDYKTSDGEKMTDFFDCTVWRQKGDFVSKNFSKGQLIVVDGSMESRKWTDKNGCNRVSWSLTAREIYFAGDRRANNSGEKAAEDDAEPELPPAEGSAPEMEDPFGDLGDAPF